MSLKAKIEAVLYASGDPVTLVQLVGLLGEEAQAELDVLRFPQAKLYFAGEKAPAQSDVQQGGSEDLPASVLEEKRSSREGERALRDYLRGSVEELIRDYGTPERGIEIREVAGGYRFSTKAEYHDAVRGFVKSLKPPLKLTLQALETLAVVAYKQPVTAPEVSEIRGVDSGGVLGSLMARKLITTAGRKQVIGRPILYKTTKDFLLRFGLKDVSELPSISEFEKMAGELAAQEDMLMDGTIDRVLAEERVTHENLAEEAHSTEPQADGDPGGLDADETTQPNEQFPGFDGSVTSVPPSYDASGKDVSADEATITHGSEGEEANVEAQIRPVPDTPDDLAASDVVATPEGDNEILPWEPIGPAADAAVSGLEVPRGNETDEYKNDKV